MVPDKSLSLDKKVVCTISQGRFSSPKQEKTLLERDFLLVLSPRAQSGI